MKRNNQFKFLALLVALAYVLSACTGALPATNANQGQDDQPQEVVFTGTVEAIGGGEWTISGPAVTVSGNTKVDEKIMVGGFDDWSGNPDGHACFRKRDFVERCWNRPMDFRHHRSGHCPSSADPGSYSLPIPDRWDGVKEESHRGSRRGSRSSRVQTGNR